MIKQFILSFIASLTFSIIFNIRGKKLLFSALGGGITYLFFFIFTLNSFSSITSCFLATIISASYSEIMSIKLKSPVTLFIISSVIPLVPGGGLYYTMYYIISKNYEKALILGTETFEIALAIVISILLVSTISKLIKKKVS